MPDAVWLHALHPPRALGLPQRFEKALASILEPDLNGARRHVELVGDDLTLLETRKRVFICDSRRGAVQNGEWLALRRAMIAGGAARQASGGSPKLCIST